MITNHIYNVLILASVCMVITRAVIYDDLEAMGIECAAQISCARITSNFTGRNCECDRDCIVYDDCCIDASIRRFARSRRTNHYSCFPYGNNSNKGVYVINTCTRSFAGPAEVQTKCQNQYDISDPMMATPVTDNTTLLTYANRHCAECNNVLQKNMQAWLILMNCDSMARFNLTTNYVWEHVSYRPDLNKWGAVVNGNFYACDLQFDKPNYVEGVRLCRPNLISQCPMNWTARTTLRDECESYTAVMYGGGPIYNVYKNPHCALCHGQNMQDLSCDFYTLSSRKKPFSFALLLDVNQNDGEKVGMTSQGTRCGANQKYDPYFKKCRELVCAVDGFKTINGKCQKV